jgi:nucleoside-diphosphate-sugar epimerase
MRALVLGHTGLLGAATMAALQQTGWPAEGVSSGELDLTSPAAAEQLTQRIDADTALVMAASIRREDGDTPETGLRIIAMAQSVAQAVRQRPPAVVVFVSSVSVYGTTRAQDMVNEATRIILSTPYATAKRSSEQVIQEVARVAGVPLAIIRPCRIYGRGDRRAGYGPSRFVEDAVTSGTITLFGDGEERRDHVFVDDLAYAIVTLAMHRWSGVVNAASGESLPFRRIAERVQDAVARATGRAVQIASRPRTGAIVDQRVDVHRLAGLVPGWPLTPIEVGIQHCVDAAIARLETSSHA